MSGVNGPLVILDQVKVRRTSSCPKQEGVFVTCLPKNLSRATRAGQKHECPCMSQVRIFCPDIYCESEAVSRMVVRVEIPEEDLRGS